MKGNKSLIAISIAVTLAITPSAIAAPKTTLKAAGRVITNVVNTILSGPGVPTKTVGIDGDFYIDTKNADLYGPKTKGVWKVTTSLKQAPAKSVVTANAVPGAIGDKGEKGDKGATGSTGATGSNGATGPAGAVGAKGSDGAPGAAGFSGAAGSVGATGSVGSPGAPGAAGAAGTNGTNGINGVDGADGAAGTPGSPGTPGTPGGKGDTGLTGADGVSVSKFNILPTIEIDTTSGGFNAFSNFFTVAEAGNYTFEVLVSGTNTTTDNLNFTAQIISAGSAIGNQFSVSSAAVIGTTLAPGHRFGIVLIGVVANAVVGASYGVRITLVTAGETTYSVYFTGRALINKVGSIG